MDAYEIARRANALPDLFAARVPEQTLTSLRQMRGGGEHGELVIELTASLANSGARVSPAEKEELRALLEATEMPTHLLDRLVVLP
jgi:hypothetical protein